MTDTAPGRATGRVKREATAFTAAQAERLLAATGRGLGRATARLTDRTEGGSAGLMKLTREQGKRAAGAGASALKEKVTAAVRAVPRTGRGGHSAEDGGGFLTVIEDIDIGVPVREAYGQWTQFQEFSGFARGVEEVEQIDDATTHWRAKVLWSSRSWQARITEQVPDERIAWTSEGAKGATKGVVTFHRLGDTLTRVLLVIEYHPKGLLERTGALWRAQGRRARLDLKHFRRFVMLRGEATGGWMGEIHDGEVRDGGSGKSGSEKSGSDGNERKSGDGERADGDAKASDGTGSGGNGRARKRTAGSKRS
jgi:uncharacterized membrane protein